MKTGFRFSAVVVIILSFMLTGGCATAITYTFEPRVKFPELKTYQWAKAKPTYRQDSLLESNVRFVADRDLEAKGLTSKTDKPDLLVWISYDLGSPSDGYELRILILNISQAHNNQLIWRGLARGNIKTDAASGELKKAVEGMLVNFPPK